MRTRDYLIRFPGDLSVRVACEVARCDNWQFGWETILDERTPQGRDLAYWVRAKSMRTVTEHRAAGGLTVFRFERGQRCFEEHQTRPARFIAGGRRLASLGDWTGDLGDHVTRLEDQLRKG